MNDCLEGTDKCRYTQKLVFEIIDDDGVVRDRTTHELLVPLTFNQSIALKYVRLLHSLQGGIEDFVSLTGGGGGEEPGLSPGVQEALLEVARGK